MTWMEWIYASCTLLHDEQSALQMEEFVVGRTERLLVASQSPDYNSPL